MGSGCRGGTWSYEKSSAEVGGPYRCSCTFLFRVYPGELELTLKEHLQSCDVRVAGGESCAGPRRRERTGANDGGRGVKLEWKALWERVHISGVMTSTGQWSYSDRCNHPINSTVTFFLL